MKILLIIGAIGIVLVLLSEMIHNKDTPTSITAKAEVSDTYSMQIEESLVDILEQVEGVGKVRVMLTVSCTEEYVYAEEVNSSMNRSEILTPRTIPVNFSKRILQIVRC